MNPDRYSFHARRLLHDINDAARLRRNPLVLAYFVREGNLDLIPDREIVTRVRSLIAENIERVGPEFAAENSSVMRQRAILRRCDLLGEEHERVAQALNISRRQFYRERKRAIEDLASGLSRNAPAPLSETVVSIPISQLHWEQISLLHMTGHFEAAFRQLDQFVAYSDDSARVRAWCRGVEIATDAGESALAEHYLRLAQIKYAEIPDEKIDEDLFGRIAVASARVDWHGGRSPDAFAAVESALQQLSARDLTRPEVTEALGDALILGARRCSEIRKIDSGLLYLARFRELCDSLTTHRPLTRADLAAELGSVHCLIPNHLSLALEEMQTALSIRQTYNDLRGVARSSSDLCTLFAICGKIEESLHFGRSAIEIGKAVCRGRELAYMYLKCAQTEALAGNSQHATDHAILARQHATSGVVVALSLMALAEAHLASGNFTSAIDLSRQVRAAMSKFGADRFVGPAWRIEADAQHSLGLADEARVAIGHALDVQEHYGHPFSSMRTFLSSARIQGEVKHRNIATDLAASLGWHKTSRNKAPTLTTGIAARLFS